MNNQSQVNWVGVDWGTSHRRGYGFDTSDNCVVEHIDDQGALVSRGRHAHALQDLLTAMDSAPRMVLMSGMVGSTLGWQDVPYVSPDVALEELAKHLARVHNAPSTFPSYIVPGYRVRNAIGQPDVMRGEETQLLGAVAMGQRDGWFVLPGTHSKWVQLVDGRVTQLRTYMTGELFSLLSSHGTLAASAKTPATQSPSWDASAFAAGVAASARGTLSNRLFACRALVVTGDMPATSARSYLSGLLIGSELHDVVQGDANQNTPVEQTDSFTLIGSASLAEHYLFAAQQMQLTLNVLDSKAAILKAFSFLHSNVDPL